MRLLTIVFTIAVFLCACDGVIDTNMEPPKTDVQIVVRDGAVPQAGIRVVFQASDDTLIAEAITGPDGLAVAEMPDGGNLTVIRTYPIGVAPEDVKPVEVYTYVGVKGGDRLQIGHATSDGTPSAINVMVPELATGAVQVSTPCGSGQGTAPNVPLTVRGCPSMVPFYVTDQDQSSFVARAAYAENVDLSTMPLSGKLSTTLSAINIPPGTTVSVEKRLVVDGFTIYSSGPQNVTGGPATVNLPNLFDVEQLVVAAMATAGHTQIVASHSAVGGASAVDASLGLIAAVTTQPILAPTGISWTDDGIGGADMVVATLSITRAEGGQPGAYDDVYHRAIIAPYASTSLRLPVLQGADAIYNPTAADQIAGTHALARVTGGYNAIRAQAFAVSSLVDATPMEGLVTLSFFGATPPSL